MNRIVGLRSRKDSNGAIQCLTYYLLAARAKWISFVATEGNNCRKIIKFSKQTTYKSKTSDDIDDN